MNLFGWADDPPFKPSATERLDYEEWRRIAAKHMWAYWFVEIEDVDEDTLRAAYEEGTAPRAFVNDLAEVYDWIDFGPWSR
jgi:hypothetical protein